MSVLRRLVSALVLLLFAARSCLSQDTLPKIIVEVHADQPDGPMIPIWNYFGYDEPNYTYAPNGRKLLGELAALNPAPVYVRVHNLLTTGDGSAALKWGSTNVYTEDAAGKPVYSWTILDRIFDTFHAARIKPLVEIGFMPEALSTHPQPYRHSFPQGSVFTGWAYPPKDYQKWSELVFQFVRHLSERYGTAETRTWLWEVWNEPDIAYWQGTREEFLKLYDYSADAVLRALPDARIGGPDSTGPASPKAAEFLRAFLDHCAHQRKFVTGKTGSRLDFVAFHPKGSPTWQGDARTNRQNGYRNGALYAAYTAEAVNAAYALATREQVRLAGSVSWSFEFEDQPYFEGFRELATNGLDKPVLNAFRMFGLLGSERVKVSSTGAIPTEKVLSAGVRQDPNISAIATRKIHEIEVLIWNYHDEDVDAPATPIDLVITGLPESSELAPKPGAPIPLSPISLVAMPLAPISLAMVEHFRVDSHHSNAFTAWKQIGSPQSPSPEQYEQLQSAGQLQLLTSPAWIPLERGEAHLQFTLPRQGLSLLRITW